MIELIIFIKKWTHCLLSWNKKLLHCSFKSYYDKKTTLTVHKTIRRPIVVISASHTRLVVFCVIGEVLSRIFDNVLHYS